MSAETGYVYLMVCAAMPDLVKVGCSTNDPLLRARQLSASTSAALPFTLAYSRHVNSPFQVEAALHRELDEYRVNDSREFFKVPLHQVITLVERYEEVGIPLSCDEIDLSFSELFATFPDDGSPRFLTPSEQERCRELERKSSVS